MAIGMRWAAGRRASLVCRILMLLAAPAATAGDASSKAGCALTAFEDTATGLTGFRDAFGKVVIPARYRHSDGFDGDLAGTLRDRDWGYLDCEGRFFAVMTYDIGPDPFSEGLVRIREQGRIGFADRRGEVVITPRFEWAERFCHGRATVGEDCTRQQDGEHERIECRAYYPIDRQGRRLPAPKAGMDDAEECAP